MLDWCRKVTEAFSALPQFSSFSGTDPNSRLTGFSGDIAINYAPAAATVLWVKHGSVLVPTTSNWSGVA
jgi:hypothetical protein